MYRKVLRDSTPNDDRSSGSISRRPELERLGSLDRAFVNGLLRFDDDDRVKVMRANRRSKEACHTARRCRRVRKMGGMGTLYELPDLPPHITARPANLPSVLSRPRPGRSSIMVNLDTRTSLRSNLPSPCRMSSKPSTAVTPSSQRPPVQIALSPCGGKRLTELFESIVHSSLRYSQSRPSTIYGSWKCTHTATCGVDLKAKNCTVSGLRGHRPAPFG